MSTRDEQVNGKVSIGIGNASDVVLIEANPREVIGTAPIADAVGDVYATKTRAGGGWERRYLCIRLVGVCWPIQSGLRSRPAVESGQGTELSRAGAGWEVRELAVGQALVCRGSGGPDRLLRSGTRPADGFRWPG